MCHQCPSRLQAQLHLAVHHQPLLLYPLCACSEALQYACKVIECKEKQYADSIILLERIINSG